MTARMPLKYEALPAGCVRVAGMRNFCSYWAEQDGRWQVVLEGRTTRLLGKQVDLHAARAEVERILSCNAAGLEILYSGATHNAT